MRPPDISNLNGTVIRFTKRRANLVVVVRAHEQQHEPAAAGAQQLAADRAGLHRRVEQMIDGGVGDAIRERPLELPRLLQELPNSTRSVFADETMPIA